MDLILLRQALADIYPDAELTDCDRLEGGVSADVYRIDFRVAGKDIAPVVLRCHGDSHGGHAAQLEYELLKALYEAGLPVPQPLLVDDSCGVLSDPFLVIGFMAGSAKFPAAELPARVPRLAQALAQIHNARPCNLPTLPQRLDPLPELFEFMPEGEEWQDLIAYLRTLEKTSYTGPQCLLHGDYWPENILWQDGDISAVLDWEDAALGDPLSDVAAARVELRYLHGSDVMEQFSNAYAEYAPVDTNRLALWQIYVAAAAHCYMGHWGLAPEREAHMRREALASMREAAAQLMASPSETE